MRIIYAAIYITVPVILASWSFKSYGFQDCQDQQPRYTESQSCVNHSIPEREGASRLDISKHTFDRMIEALRMERLQRIPITSRLHTTLSLINDKVAGASQFDTIIFYYDNDYHGAGNADCSLYTARKVEAGVLASVRKVEPAIDKAPCDDSSYDLAILFKYVTEPEGALMISPAEQYLFAEYPASEVAEIYESAAIDHWLLFNIRFNVPVDVMDDSLRKMVAVDIPTWTYVNDVEGSLWEITDRLELGSASWELLWELNLEDIDDPATVAAGIELRVPATIDEWNEVAYADQAPEVLATEHYGDQSYAAVVGRYIDALYLQRTENVLFLPVFKADTDFEFVTVMTLMR